MANSAREGVKQYLLLALVVISVVLIGLTWVDNLNEAEPGGSGFQRGTAPAPTLSVQAATPVLPTLAPPTLSLPPGDELSGEE